VIALLCCATPDTLARVPRSPTPSFDPARFGQMSAASGGGADPLVVLGHLPAPQFKSGLKDVRPFAIEFDKDSDGNPVSAATRADFVQHGMYLSGGTHQPATRTPSYLIKVGETAAVTFPRNTTAFALTISLPYAHDETPLQWAAKAYLLDGDRQHCAAELKTCAEEYLTGRCTTAAPLLSSVLITAVIRPVCITALAFYAPLPPGASARAPGEADSTRLRRLPLRRTPNRRLFRTSSASPVTAVLFVPCAAG
jgi:hypothetical protein